MITSAYDFLFVRSGDYVGWCVSARCLPEADELPHGFEGAEGDVEGARSLSSDGRGDR